MNQYHNIPSLDCLWTQYWTVKFTQLYLVEGQLQILINVGCMENQTEIYSTTLCFLGEKTRVWNKRWGLEWDIISTCENGIFYWKWVWDSRFLLHFAHGFFILNQEWYVFCFANIQNSSAWSRNYEIRPHSVQLRQAQLFFFRFKSSACMVFWNWSGYKLLHIV